MFSLVFQVLFLLENQHLTLKNILLMLKAGVLGAGHLGKIHLRLLQQSEKYELVGFYDPFTENAEKVAAEFGYKLFDSVASLIAAVDMIDIVTPTLSHFDCAKEAID